MNENYQPRGGATINNGPTKGGTTANNRNGNNRNKYKNNNSNNNNKGANTNSNQNHQRQNSNFANNSDANLKPTPQYNNSQNSNHLNSFNDFSASCSNPPYNLEFGNQKSKKYTPFNKFTNGNNGNAPANMQSVDTFGANVNGCNNGGGAKKKRNNRRKNGNNNAVNNANNSNNFQRTNSFGNNITNNHYRVKPFSTERLNKSLNKEYSTSSNSSFEDNRPRIQTSLSLDNFESFTSRFKRSPTMPISLSTFSHDQYSNVNTSPSQATKLKFQREESTIQESVEDDEKPANNSHIRDQQLIHSQQQVQQQHSLTITCNQDDSVSFYSTPLNGTKNDSTSSSSSGLNEEQLAKFLANIETTTTTTCSSASISPCSKMFNELSSNNVGGGGGGGGGESSQLLVTASEGESSSYEIDEEDAVTEKTIIHGATTGAIIEMSYEKELLESLENRDCSEVPFSIEKLVCIVEDNKESVSSTAENDNQLLSENILTKESENTVDFVGATNTDTIPSMTLLPSSSLVDLVDDYGMGSYVDLITPESLSIPHEHDLNLVDVHRQMEKDKICLINEEATLKYKNIEEEEVNDLVNKIVVDVIANAARADELCNLKKEVHSLQPETAVEIMDHQKIREETVIVNLEPDHFSNDAVVTAKPETLKIDEILTNEERNKNDESVLIDMSSQEIDSILKKSDAVAKNVEAKKEAKSSAKKDANKKDAVVDCFSCTIV